MRIKILAILALATLLLTSVVSANHDNGNGLSQDRKPKINESLQKEMEEKRKVIDEAIENGDYEKWKSLLIQDMFSQERFNKLAENRKRMNEARQNQTTCGGDFRPMPPRDFGNEFEDNYGARRGPQGNNGNHYGQFQDSPRGPQGNNGNNGNHYEQRPTGPDNGQNGNHQGPQGPQGNNGNNNGPQGNNGNHYGQRPEGPDNGQNGNHYGNRRN